VVEVEVASEPGEQVVVGELAEDAFGAPEVAEPLVVEDRASPLLRQLVGRGRAANQFVEGLDEPPELPQRWAERHRALERVRLPLAEPRLAVLVEPAALEHEEPRGLDGSAIGPLALVGARS